MDIGNKRKIVNIQLTNTIFSYLVLFCLAKGNSKKEAISWLEKLLHTT